MYSIALHLQKGGVGKTTLSGSLAYELSKYGKTILIDADPQSNTSSWFLDHRSVYKFELADILLENCYVKNAIIDIENISIIPSFGLGGKLKLYSQTKIINEPYCFRDIIDILKSDFDYKFCIIDLSPAIGLLEKSALIAIDEVITPMTPEFFSLDGLEIFANELKTIEKNIKICPQYNKIILNAFDARISQHAQIKNKTETLQHKIYTIPVDPVFRKSQAMRCFPQDINMKIETRDMLSNIAKDLQNGN